MTQAEYDAEVSVIENEQQRLRTLLSVADLVPRDWALSGFEFKRKMDLMDAQLALLLQQLRFSKFLAGQRMAEKRKNKAQSFDSQIGVKTSNKLSRQNWRTVGNEDIALKFKHDGFTVRCIGVKEWQVLA